MLPIHVYTSDYRFKIIQTEKRAVVINKSLYKDHHQDHLLQFSVCPSDFFFCAYDNIYRIFILFTKMEYCFCRFLEITIFWTSINI